MTDARSHANLIQDVGADVPARLPVLLTALIGAGGTLLDPGERAGLHPLVIPLVREELGDTVGLLRWPTPDPNTPLPVVRQRPGPAGWTLELVAPSTDAHLHRHLAIRDARGETLPEPLLTAVNALDTLYEPGQLALSGLPLKAYLLVRVGETHAFFEELCEAHLTKGDTTAAAVTADRACRQDHGWARPWVYRAHLLARMGQHEEARDTARLALAEPVWTFGHPFAELAKLAGWGTSTSIAYRKLANHPDKPPADRAAHLMDATAIDGGDWDSVRDELGERYEQAGLQTVARLVRG